MASGGMLSVTIQVLGPGGPDAPATKGQGRHCPSVGRNCPSVGRNCPSVGRNCPSVGRNCPSVGRNCPSVGGNCPSVGGNCPSVERNCPSVGVTVQVLAGNCPSASSWGWFANGIQRPSLARPANNPAGAQKPGRRSTTWQPLKNPHAAAAAEVTSQSAQRKATPARQAERRNPAEEWLWAAERARRRPTTHGTAPPATDRPCDGLCLGGIIPSESQLVNI
jgi:hypothetical protein